MHSPIPSIDIERRQKISLREPPVNSLKTVNATTRTTTIVRSSYRYATRGTSDTTGTQKCVHDKTTKTESLVPTSNRTSHHRTQPRPTSEWEAHLRIVTTYKPTSRSAQRTHVHVLVHAHSIRFGVRTNRTIRHDGIASRHEASGPPSKSGSRPAAICIIHHGHTHSTQPYAIEKTPLRLATPPTLPIVRATAATFGAQRARRTAAVPARRASVR